MRIFNTINWLDLLALGILIRGVYLGIRTGLTAELFRFIGTLLSLTLAIHWYYYIAEILILNLSLPAWIARFLCFVIISQIVRLIFKYGVVLLMKVLNIQFLPQLERAGGAVVGFGRGTLVIGILILTLKFLPSEYMNRSIGASSFSGAFLVKATERTYRALTFWIPDSKVETSIFSLPTTRTRVKKI